MKKYIPSFLLLFAFICVWKIVATIVDAPYILPTPFEICMKLWDLKTELLFVHLPATLIVMIAGLMLSLLIGCVIALLMHINQWVERALYPLLITSQTIPVIALAPIFVMGFGYSVWGRIFMTILITFFPITIGIVDGLRSRNIDMEELLLTMGSSKRQIFTRLSIPAMLPHFFTSLKVAAPLSVIGAAIGEWLGAQAGLGYFSRRMMTQFDGAAIFAPIILLSVLGIGLFLIIVWMEHIVLKWRNE